MVEHLTYNEKVNGSSPLLPRKVNSSAVERWFPKSKVVGSNPSLLVFVKKNWIDDSSGLWC